jgi:shikimate 5-dehydrogenase
MPANYKAELVGVIGQPVAENPTGVMQEAAFAARGLNWRYLTMEVPPSRLAEAVAGARALGFRGFNVTIPHKVAVMQYLDGVSPEARMIGAVNTVRREGDCFIGENTDGKGFLRGVRVNAGVDPKGKRVFLLGAGGAARAIATELALAGAAEIVVLNRTEGRGAAMVDDLCKNTGVKASLVVWRGTHIIPEGFDLVVNATSVGLYPDVDAMPDIDLGRLAPGTLVCDAVFNPPETRLLRTAKSLGLPVLDGLSMLVYQGVIGFEIWTGQAAPETVMYEALQKALRD